MNFRPKGLNWGVPRAYALLAPLLLAAGSARAFEEASVANRNLAAIMIQLETGTWNDRIHAVHELDYLQAEGIPGLAFATDDGDWQVRLTAVHALGGRGAEGTPVLNRLLKYEPCPVVRLMTLHSLGSAGPEGEEAKAMGWISGASGKELNACVDQAGPGRAAWARKKGLKTAGAAAPTALPERVRAAPRAPRRQAPPPEPAAEAEEDETIVVTRDPILPPAPAPAATAPRPAPEELPEPTKFQRHAQLDALLDLSTEAAPRRGVDLAMTGRRALEPESLPRPEGLVPRDHAVDAPGLLMDDAGTGKTAHDALPSLLRALKTGDARTRARASDDLGHLGAKAAPALPALMAALGDRSPRVRASAGLALGNIGAEHGGVVRLLTKALKDRSEDVRYAAALALSRIDTAEAREAFGRHVGKEARRAIDRPGSGRIRP